VVAAAVVRRAGVGAVAAVAVLGQERPGQPGARAPVAAHGVLAAVLAGAMPVPRGAFVHVWEQHAAKVLHFNY